MKLGILVPTAFECEDLPDCGLPMVRGTFGPGKVAIILIFSLIGIIGSSGVEMALATQWKKTASTGPLPAPETPPDCRTGSR